jgi:periplasmic divalent cation tolerance protein
MILLYVTCKNKAEAKKIASHLLKNRLITCSNFFPIDSMYRWKNKIVNDKEYVLILKSFKQKQEKIIKAIEKIHSYEIPCIEVIETKSNRKYQKWSEGEVK